MGKRGRLAVWTDEVEGERGARVHVVMVGDRLIAIVRNEVQAEVTARQLREVIKEAKEEGKKHGS